LFFKQKNSEARRLHNLQKMPPNLNNIKESTAYNNEKVLVVGNRLANLNATYKRSDRSDSNEALDALLNNNQQHQHQLPILNYKKQQPHSNTSLHIDSALSVSGHSQQSTPTSSPLAGSGMGGLGQTSPNNNNNTALLSQPLFPPPVQTATPPPANIVTDDAQMVDFVSSFLFPISFIIFNIVYWMVYLNMQVEFK
jgi:hypothetical protein